MLLGNYGFGPEMDRIIDEAAETVEKNELKESKARRERKADEVFLAEAFKIDEDKLEKKELWQSYMEYLEENQLQDIQKVIGNPRSWEEFKNAVEYIQSKDPQMSSRIMNSLAKFKKTPR